MPGCTPGLCLQAVPLQRTDETGKATCRNGRVLWELPCNAPSWHWGRAVLVNAQLP